MLDKRLMKEVPQAKKWICKQVGMQWVSLLCSVVIIISIANILQRAYERTMTQQSLSIAFVLCIVFVIIRMICVKKATQYSYEASCDVKEQLRTRVYRKLLSLRHTYQEHMSTSELVQLSVEGIDQLEIYFGKYVPQFFYSMIAPITLFFILVWFDWKSALVLLLCVPLIPLSIVAVQTFAKRLLSKYWSSYVGLGDSFLENLQGLTTLKIYQADEAKQQTMNQEAEHFRNITMKVLTMQLNSISVMDIVAYGGAAFGSIIAVSGFLNGTVSFIGVIVIVLLSSEFFIPLRLLGSFFHIAMNGIEASAKIFKLLDIEELHNQHIIVDDESIHVTLQDVRFAYQKQQYVIDRVSLTIATGQFTAIVGESGSGKSTLAKLIMGIERGYQGRLQIGKHERCQIVDDSFFKHICYVPHTMFLMKGSVQDNLQMAKKNASIEEMEVVLKEVCLYDFLQGEQGLQTPIAENGSNFSGGQKQRLALARALLMDAQMYIFDEATSNIDVESENTILAVIERLAKQKTILMITHRLSSVQHCKQIFVMKDGTLVEQGNHQELCEQAGYYNEMYQQQQLLEAYCGGEEDA